MILDKRAEFDDGTGTIPTTATTAIIGNVIDTLPPTVKGANLNQNLGNSDLWLVVRTKTSITTLTSLRLRLVSDAQEALATDGSATQHWDSGVIAQASLPTAGNDFVVMKLPKGNYERYLGMIATTVGTGAVGKIFAFLVTDPNELKHYSDNVT